MNKIQNSQSSRDTNNFTHRNAAHKYLLGSKNPPKSHLTETNYSMKFQTTP